MKGFSSLFEDVVWELICFLGTDPSRCHMGDECAKSLCLLTKMGCVNILFDI